MKKPQTIYKVCYKHPNGKLLSYIANHFPAPRAQYSLTYDIGKTTRPKIKDSYLMAFETYEQARLLAGDASNWWYGVYEAQAILVENPPPGVPLLIIGANYPTIDITKAFKSFWQEKKDTSRYPVFSLREGTVFCEEITLIKEIK